MNVSLREDLLVPVLSFVMRIFCFVMNIFTVLFFLKPNIQYLGSEPDVMH